MKEILWKTTFDNPCNETYLLKRTPTNSISVKHVTVEGYQPGHVLHNGNVVVTRLFTRRYVLTKYPVVINGYSTPVNGIINGFAWGEKTRQKRDYNSTYNDCRGPPWMVMTPPRHLGMDPICRCRQRRSGRCAEFASLPCFSELIKVHQTNPTKCGYSMNYVVLPSLKLTAMVGRQQKSSRGPAFLQGLWLC